MDENTIVKDTTCPSLGGNDAKDNNQKLSNGEIKRNMLSLVLLETTFWTGSADIQLALNPLLVFLGATNFLIGIVNGAMFAGLLGVFLSPWITKRFRYKKWYLFVGNVPYLTALAILGILAVHSVQLGLGNSFSYPSSGWLSKWIIPLTQSIGLADKTILLWWAVGLYYTHWLFGGFVTLPCTEYIAACIPMSHRGRLTGYAYSAAGFFAIGAAFAGKWIIDHVSHPAAFGYVLLMGWALMQFGYACSLIAKETPTPVERSPKPYTREMFQAFWQDKPYVKLMVLFFLYNMLLQGSTFNFINVYGLKQLHMALGTAAIMIIVSRISQFLTSTPLGLINDRLSPKRTIPYLFALSALAWMAPVVIPGPPGVYVGIATYTMFTTAITSAQTALVCGLPAPEHRAGHFTIQIVIWYIAMSIGPMIVGRLCDTIGYYPIFVSMILMSIAFFPIAKYMLRTLPNDIKAYS